MKFFLKPNFRREILIKGIFNKVLPYFFSNYIKFVYATNKWTQINPDITKNFWIEKKPFIWMHWHGQSLMLPNSWSHSKQVLNALVSRHGDGELIANTLNNLNINLIRGAGNPDKLGLKEKGGTAALRTMARVLKNGESVSFTADQPPGPGRVAGKGSIILAKISGCPIIPVAACTSKKYEFNNWDKFTVNYPFGRGVIIWGNPIYIKRNASEDDIEKSRVLLEDSLNKITIEAKEFIKR